MLLLGQRGGVLGAEEGDVSALEKLVGIPWGFFGVWFWAQKSPPAQAAAFWLPVALSRGGTEGKACCLFPVFFGLKFGLEIRFCFKPSLPTAPGPWLGSSASLCWAEAGRWWGERWSGDNELLLAAPGKFMGCVVMVSGELCARCAWMRALKNHQQIIAISPSPCGKVRSKPEKPPLLAVMIHKIEIST